MSNNISINKTTKPLVEKLIEKVSELNLSIETTEGGARIIDAGINASGCLESGR